MGQTNWPAVVFSAAPPAISARHWIYSRFVLLPLLRKIKIRIYVTIISSFPCIKDPPVMFNLIRILFPFFWTFDLCFFLLKPYSLKMQISFIAIQMAKATEGIRLQIHRQTFTKLNSVLMKREIKPLNSSFADQFWGTTNSRDIRNGVRILCGQSVR